MTFYYDLWAEFVKSIYCVGLSFFELNVGKLLVDHRVKFQRDHTIMNPKKMSEFMSTVLQYMQQQNVGHLMVDHRVKFQYIC